jgi:hypothetical protein
MVYLKQLSHEADYSPPSSGEVKNGGATPPFSNIPSWHSAQLIKDRDNFTFLFQDTVKCLTLYSTE